MEKDKRARLLYILKLLWEESDDTHPLSASVLVERLEDYGIRCERKGIYRDLDALEAFGFDIIRNKRGAYMGSRLFELPELRLLADAVQSAQFITEKKSRELIGKLGILAGRTGERELRHLTRINNRIKTMNESIYYNVDRISEAMEKGCQLSFCYCMWNVDRKLEPKHGGMRYVISPWLLLWESERYYLIGYDEVSDKLKHFRVDKMLQIEKLENRRLGRERYQSVDAAEYARRHFGMYQGVYEIVTLLCENELVGAIIDHFGRDIWMHPVDEQYFRVSVGIVVSDKFFGWLTGYAGRIQILEPERVRLAYRERLEELLKKTGDSTNINR
ncbi:MAG: WYL domain-containing protein [Lachnospiraceae bacterium]|nr:WYL domain-containing protein [Lachnospiraceae bacterium]